MPIYDPEADKHYRTAVECFQRNNLEKAIPELETALSIDKTHAPAWAALGTSYIYSEKDLVLVEYCCRESLRLGLSKPSLYTTLATHLSRNLLDHLALLTLEKGLERFPEDAHIRKLLVEYYMEEEDWLRTMHHLEMLTAQYPESHDYWVNLALCYWSQEYNAEALQAAEWAIFCEPANGWGYFVAGHVFLKTPNHLAKAYEMFQEAVDLTPDLKIAQEMLNSTASQLSYLAQFN